MSEERAVYNIDHHGAILDVQRPLRTRNLEELERDLAKLERMLTPLLNQVRAMLGKESPGPQEGPRCLDGKR